MNSRTHSEKIIFDEKLTETIIYFSVWVLLECFGGIFNPLGNFMPPLPGKEIT